MGDKMHLDVQPQTSVNTAQEIQPAAGAEKESVTAVAEPTVVIQNETVIRHGFPWKACLIALAALLLAAAAVLFAARKFGLFAPQQEETPQLTTISKASLQKSWRLTSFLRLNIFTMQRLQNMMKHRRKFNIMWHIRGSSAPESISRCSELPLMMKIKKSH